ncbi:BRO-N domain-containing protein [Pseudomonas lijiangensis]|uniref:BRO-N domain-containing protein n=1 Tax=Pseudomonas lijiangensis TaxID=2995658 RepID=UPI001C898660|nr:Bro-N domain-containing protein [Pseudomonas lijiangensis]MBX8505127.1 Bro-N domain-containing protein [Pseudomonas lijiangensis]
MDLPYPSSPCTDHFEPTIFIRHHRMLRAVMLDAQVWFPLQDLARLMGKQLDERATLKLDIDQRRTVWLLTHGNWEKCLMISESGVFAMLVHHYVPENRALRRWLAQEVLPALDVRHAEVADQPLLYQMRWQGNALSSLQWRWGLRGELRDLPELVQVQAGVVTGSWWRRLMGRRRSFLA